MTAMIISAPTAAPNPTLKLEAILEKHERYIMAIALSRTGNTEDARDIFQETAFRIWLHLPEFTFKNDRATRSWVARIVQNLVTDLFRRKQTRPVEYRDEIDDSLASPWSASPKMPDELLLSKASRAELLAIAPKILTPRQLQILTLKLDDLTTEEMAIRLNIAEGSIKSHANRIRKKLLPHFKNTYPHLRE